MRAVIPAGGCGTEDAPGEAREQPGFVVEIALRDGMRQTVARLQGQHRAFIPELRDIPA